MPQYQILQKSVQVQLCGIMCQWKHVVCVITAVHFAGDGQNGNEYRMLQLRILIYKPNFEFTNSFNIPYETNIFALNYFKVV